MKKAVIAITLALSLAILGCREGTRKFLSPGDAAPEFSLADLEGKPFSLAAAPKGKEIVLVFWTSWCPECRAQLPRINELSRKYGNQAEFIGINIRGRKKEVQAFVKAKEIAFPVLLDVHGEVAYDYGVVGVPVIVLINKEGLVKKTGFDLREMESYFSKEREQ